MNDCLNKGQRTQINMQGRKFKRWDTTVSVPAI